MDFFSRRHKVYDNATNSDFFKELDSNFQVKDIVANLAVNSRTDDDSYIRIRLSSDCFKKGYTSWRFMVNFSDFKREVTKLTPHGVFSCMEDKDLRQNIMKNMIMGKSYWMKS